MFSFPAGRSWSLWIAVGALLLVVGAPAHGQEQDGNDQGWAQFSRESTVRGTVMAAAPKGKNDGSLTLKTDSGQQWQVLYGVNTLGAVTGAAASTASAVASRRCSAENRTAFTAIRTIAAAISPQLHGDDVGSGAWLGHRKRAHVFAADEFGQIFVLLRLGGELRHHGTDHVDVEPERRRHAVRLHLVLVDVELHRRPILAAPLLRPMRHGQPMGVQDPMRRDLLVARNVFAARPRGRATPSFSSTASNFSRSSARSSERRSLPTIAIPRFVSSSARLIAV